MRRVISLVNIALLFTLTVCFASPGSAQGPAKPVEEVRELAVGKPIESAIQRGSVHIYPIELKKGAVINISILEKGADVNLGVLRAIDRKVFGKTAFSEGFGRESLTALVDQDALYGVIVFGVNTIPTGKYELTVQVKESADAADLERIRAEKMMADSFADAARRTTAGFRSASEQMLQTATIWQSLGDKYWEGYVLYAAGKALDRSGDSRSAKRSYLLALPLIRSTGDEGTEAVILNDLALAHHKLDESSEAGRNLQLEIPLRKKIGDQRGEAAALGHLGMVYDLAGKKNEALLHYKESLKAIEKIGDDKERVAMLGNIGLTYKEIGEKKVGLTYLEDGLALARKINDPRSIEESLNRAGMVYGELSENVKAIKYLEEALKIAGELGIPGDIGAALNNLGRIYDATGEKEKALDHFRRALTLLRSQEEKGPGEIGAEATALTNIGNAYMGMGNPSEALKYHLEALEKSRSAINVYLVTMILINVGAAYDANGDKREAMKYLEMALARANGSGDRPSKALAMVNLGSLYLSLGNYDTAKKHASEGLQLLRATGDRRAVATALNNIGGAFRSLSDWREAANYYGQSMALAREIGDTAAEFAALNNLGEVGNSTGDYRGAVKYLNDAINVRKKAGAGASLSSTLNNLSLSHLMLGDRKEAGRLLNESLPLARSAGDRITEGKVLTNLMAFQGIWNGDRRTGIFYGKQAVNVFQGIRTNISGLDKSAQRTFLQSIEVSYRYLADLLISEGRIAEAEQVLAMLKEEEYFGYLRREPNPRDGQKALVSLNVTEKEAAEEYAKLAGEITRIGQEFGKLDAKKNALALGDTLPAEEQAQYDLLSGQLRTATTVFNRFIDDLKARFTSNDKRIANVESDLMGLLKRLDQPRTVIISTIAGEDRLNLIVTTANTQTAHTVQIKEAELNKLVAEFRAALKDPAIDPRPAGKKLYDVLFPAGLQKDLENIGADTIIWSLDGALRYAPMAALSPDGGSYLVEKYTSATIALASRHKLGGPAADRTDWKVLGMGVSKGTDVKEVTGATRSFGPLAAVPGELCSIVDDPKQKAYCEKVAKAKSRGVIGGLMLADDDFTLQNFTNFLGQAAVVHIASHFNLDPGNEANSYLLLGKGETLTMSDVQDASLAKTDLLTLSACNTAMTGGSGKNGAEVEGFAALAQNKGARSVVATLWAVADPSTRDAMTEFYRQLRSDRSVGMAEALRKAQLALMQGNYSTGETPAWRGIKPVGAPGAGPAFKQDKNAPYAHPYYWSPFILTGDWR